MVSARTVPRERDAWVIRSPDTVAGALWAALRAPISRASGLSRVSWCRSAPHPSGRPHVPRFRGRSAILGWADVRRRRRSGACRAAYLPHSGAQCLISATSRRQNPVSRLISAALFWPSCGTSASSPCAGPSQQGNSAGGAWTLPHPAYLGPGGCATTNKSRGRFSRFGSIGWPGHKIELLEHPGRFPPQKSPPPRPPEASRLIPSAGSICPRRADAKSFWVAGR